MRHPRGQHVVGEHRRREAAIPDDERGDEAAGVLRQRLDRLSEPGAGVLGDPGHRARGVHALEVTGDADEGNDAVAGRCCAEPTGDPDLLAPAQGRQVGVAEEEDRRADRRAGSAGGHLGDEQAGDIAGVGPFGARRQRPRVLLDTALEGDDGSLCGELRDGPGAADREVCRRGRADEHDDEGGEADDRRPAAQRRPPGADRATPGEGGEQTDDTRDGDGTEQAARVRVVPPEQHDEQTPGDRGGHEQPQVERHVRALLRLLLLFLRQPGAFVREPGALAVEEPR